MRHQSFFKSKSLQRSQSPDKKVKVIHKVGEKKIHKCNNVNFCFAVSNFERKQLERGEKRFKSISTSTDN